MKNPNKIGENRDIIQIVKDRFYPPVRESRRTERRFVEANGKKTSWVHEHEIRREYRVDLFGSEFDSNEFITKYKFGSTNEQGKANFFKLKMGQYGNPMIEEISNDRGICGSIIPTFWLHNGQIHILTEIDADASRKAGKEIRRAIQAGNDNPVTGPLVEHSSIPDSTLSMVVPFAPDFVSKDGESNPARIDGKILVGYGVSTNAPDEQYLKTEFDPKDKLKLKAMLLSEYQAQTANLTNEGAVFGALMSMVQKGNVDIVVR